MRCYWLDVVVCFCKASLMIRHQTARLCKSRRFHNALKCNDRNDSAHLRTAGFRLHCTRWLQLGWFICSCEWVGPPVVDSLRISQSWDCGVCCTIPILGLSRIPICMYIYIYIHIYLIYIYIIAFSPVDWANGFILRDFFQKIFNGVSRFKIDSIQDLYIVDRLR